jgi:carboxymethylenebutenolidase
MRNAMRNAGLVFVVALVVATLGCEDDPPPPSLGSAPKASAPPATASASQSATADAPSPTGILSEEEFKALHTLRGDRAPEARGKEIEIGSDRAYLSLPEDAKPPLPALVVIHEWWGLNDHIKHWSDRLAADGYAALAVDLYGGKVATTADDAMSMMKAVDDKQATERLLAAFRHLAENPDIKAEKRGSIGWCFGGKWSLELALAAPELDAAVVYYGHVSDDAARLANLKTPLLAIFGNKDEAIPPKTVDRFEFALEQAGGKSERKDFRVLRYDAPHAFANPSGDRYDVRAATESWKEVRAFLAAKLKGS